LLDEIGRGTSTFDGLSLAWAVAKQLLEKNRSYTLFATHYFELTRLVDEFKQAANVHLDAIEHGAEPNKSIVFLHKVEVGAANQSFGLQVAQLAGIPKAVVATAKRKLQQLEQSNLATDSGQPDLFSRAVPLAETPVHPVLAELDALQADDLTPKQALDALYQLKALLDNPA
jgi:DNA mismatch repair protein MutS